MPWWGCPLDAPPTKAVGDFTLMVAESFSKNFYLFY